MAGLVRGAAVAFVTLLMVSTLPFSAVAEDEDLRFESSISSTSISEWYASGEVVQLSPQFVNDGVPTTFENDPSCGAVLQVFDAAGQTVRDDQAICRGQSQMLDIASNEVHEFGSLSWDLTDANGAEVQPGWYTVVAFHTTTGQSTSQEVHVQTNVTVPEPLMLSIEATSRLGPLVAGEEMILSVTMYNPTTEPIQLPGLGDCLLQFTINDVTELSSPCLPSFTLIEGYEETIIEQRLISAGDLLPGMNSVSASLPGGSFLASIDIEVADLQDGFNPDLQSELALDIIGLTDGMFSEGEVMEVSMSMTNIG